MPESKRRKPAASTRAAAKPVKRRGPSPRWFGITILTFLLLGTTYLVVYYASQGAAPVMVDLGSWNLAIGFGLIVVGFGLATQWR